MMGLPELFIKSFPELCSSTALRGAVTAISAAPQGQLGAAGPPGDRDRGAWSPSLAPSQGTAGTGGPAQKGRLRLGQSTQHRAASRRPRQGLHPSAAPHTRHLLGFASAGAEGRSPGVPGAGRAPHRFAQASCPTALREPRVRGSPSPELPRARAREAGVGGEAAESLRATPKPRGASPGLGVEPALHSSSVVGRKDGSRTPACPGVASPCRRCFSMWRTSCGAHGGARSQGAPPQPLRVAAGSAQRHSGHGTCGLGLGTSGNTWM